MSRTEARELRIAVLSDLHADEPDENGVVGSLLNTRMPETQKLQHPLAALDHLIETDGLLADALMCAGDITNQAKPGPLKYAWDRVKSIGQRLEVEQTFATVGNHDLDSRYVYNDYDARGMIQREAPDIPVPDVRLVDRFWARHVIRTRFGDLTVVVLNTCAFHPDREGEREHGRVSEYTLSILREELEAGLAAGELGVGGVLLCHHHPSRHPQIEDEPDYDAMIRGPEVLELLGSGQFGPWMIVHGHKHRPRVVHAAGTATAPVLFSAGSISKNLRGAARNQFYILSIRLDLVKTGRMAGTGRAWDFAPGFGWVPSADGHGGLPHAFGFGNRTPPQSLANTIASLAPDLPMLWERLYADVPDLEFVMPGDFERLRQSLEDNHGLSISELHGLPHQLGRVP